MNLPWFGFYGTTSPDKQDTSWGNVWDKKAPISCNNWYATCITLNLVYMAIRRRILNFNAILEA